MIDYLFLYEHKAREYENIKLLKLALEQKGYSVVVEKTALLSYLKYLRRKNRPKVIVTYSLYNDFSIATLVLSVVGKAKKVVNLQWEQVFTNNKDSIALHTPSENATQAVHICWGDESRKRLEENGVKNAVLTGAIQLDFLRPEFQSYYLDRNELQKKFSLPNGNMILYISSFTQVGLKDKEKAVLRDKLGDDYIDNLEKCLMTRRVTLEWLDALLELDPNCYVVYRPHPGENMDSELEMRVSRGRFYVIRDCSVKQWITVADKIYTWISTSIVEAFFAGKMCYIIRPYPVDKKFDMQLYEGADVIDSLDKMLASYNDDNMAFPIEKRVINQFYNTDNEFAFRRIVELLENVYKCSSYDMVHYPTKLYFKALKTIINRMIKKTILSLNITSKTIIVRRIGKISKWLDFFYYYQQKENMEVVSDAEDAEIERKLKAILEKL